MKINFTVKSLNGDLVELLDEQGAIVNLPSRYFSKAPELNQSLAINFDDYSSGREILQEIFKQN